MILQVTVDYLPAKERLDALFALAGDLFPAMSAIGMEMENRVRGRFETETDPLGLRGQNGRRAPRRTTRRMATRNCSTALVDADETKK